jgi:F5/8 type C domain
MRSIISRASMAVVMLCGLTAGIAISTPANAADTVLSTGQPVMASSTYSSSYPASYAVDGISTTRWSSIFSSAPQWIYVDLGRTATIDRVVLNWERAFGAAYSLQVSLDGTTWTSIYSTTTGDGGTDDITVTPSTGRYVRMYGTQRGCTGGCAQFYGYSLYEFDVYGTDLPLVKGGYYAGGGADFTTQTVKAGMNLKSMTTYRSLYDKNVFPGYNAGWISALMTTYGVEPNFVVETKEYGGPPGSSITCNGTTYSIPVADTTAGVTGSQLYYGYDQIINHQLDGLLCNAVNQLNAMPPGPINVQFESERDTKHQQGITQGTTTMTWPQADTASIPAIQYEMAYFRARNTRTPAPTFTAGMGGFDKTSFLDSYVPGVDYIQYNAYNHGSTTQSPYTIFDRTYQWLSLLPPDAANKQVIIAEWGTSSSLNNQPAYIEATPAAIALLPRIRMTNYFNSGWGLLSPTQPGLDALKVAYSELPYTG